MSEDFTLHFGWKAPTIIWANLRRIYFDDSERFMMFIYCKQHFIFVTNQQKNLRLQCGHFDSAKMQLRNMCCRRHQTPSSLSLWLNSNKWLLNIEWKWMIKTFNLFVFIYGKNYVQYVSLHEWIHFVSRVCSLKLRFMLHLPCWMWFLQCTQVSKVVVQSQGSAWTKQYCLVIIVQRFRTKLGSWTKNHLVRGKLYCSFHPTPKFLSFWK